MRSFWKVGLAGILLISLVLVSTSKETPSAFIEMEVKGVRLDAIGQNPVVILADKDGKKAIPIWIGLAEANAIDKELRNITSPRPMTHDLIYSILEHLKAKVKEVRIVEIKDSTYYATLFLILNKGLIEIDARPSDAIVIALKSKTPIFVSIKVLDEQGIALSKENAFAERYGIRVQELTSSLASHFNFKRQKGVLVSEVLPGSTSEGSGIKAGDIITKINRKEVGTVQEFEEVLGAVRAGTVLISIFRDGKFSEIDLSLKP